jgi:hypothetical protein
MVSIPKVVGVMSCGVLLCLGLSTRKTRPSGWSLDDQLAAIVFKFPFTD